MIYQQNTLGADIAAIDDGNNNTITHRYKLGDQLVPDSIALSKDGKILYANATNRFEFWQNPLLNPRSCFAAWSTESREELWRLELPGSVEHFAHSPDRKYFYNAHYDRKLLSRVNVDTQEVDYCQLASMGGHKVRVSADGAQVYVGSMTWRTLEIIDAEKMKLMNVQVFDDDVRPFVISQDRKFAYVQLNGLHGFHVLDLDRLHVVNTVYLPELPPDKLKIEEHYPYTTDHGIEITGDQKYLLALATTGHYVAVYSYPDLALVKTIDVGEQPSYLCVSADSITCYVSCRVSGELYKIDLPTLTIREVVKDVGAYPQRICLDH